MMRSLYSGASGLRNHQTRMDVIGNNISNVNTIGFKSSRTIFQDIFSQTSKVASGSTATVGGTNPIQIGLGVTLSTIDVLHTESATQRTDNTLDFAISGDGFFVVDVGGSGLRYTRAGNMYVDNDGFLVNGSGYFLQGVMYGTPTEDFDTTNTAPDDNPVASTALSNINTKGYKNISIDDKGVIRGIDNDPANTTTYGKTVILGYVALATFENPSGLEKIGNSLYSASGNSGAAVLYAPQKGAAGAMTSGVLEMSNVDLASEFTDMIVTQRGFQANSRVITTSDQMLEELVNLKR